MTLLAKPGQSPFAFVYLSQVPYTGFEGTPAAKALFYTALILWSAVLSYLITARRFGSRLLAFARDRIAAPERFAASAQAGFERQEIVLPSAAPAPANLPTEYGPEGLSTVLASARRKPAIAEDNLRELEEAAHRERLLMSDEALHALLERFGVSGASRTLPDLAAKAKAHYPREDGWVHMNAERLRALLENNASPRVSFSPSAEAPAISREQEAVRRAAPESPAEARRGGAFGPHRLLELLVSAKEAELFAALRDFLASGKNFGAAMRETVLLLDVYYRSIRGEGESPDAALKGALSRFAPEDVERLMEILLAGVDGSYVSPAVGAKVTLLRALDFCRSRT